VVFLYIATSSFNDRQVLEPKRIHFHKAHIVFTNVFVLLSCPCFRVFVIHKRHMNRKVYLFHHLLCIILISQKPPQMLPFRLPNLLFWYRSLHLFQESLLCQCLKNARKVSRILTGLHRLSLARNTQGCLLRFFYLVLLSPFPYPAR